MAVKLIDQLPAIAGAAAAGLFLLGLAAKGVRRMWHLARDLNEFLAEVRGSPADPTSGRPAQLSLMRRLAQIEGSVSRVAALEARLDAHLAEHRTIG